MDESSDGNNKTAFSVAAVIGTKAKWDWLEEQWSELLTDCDLAYFRNADCTGVEGPFLKFRENPEERTDADFAKALALREELLNLCIQSRVTIIGVAIDMKDYREVVNTPERVAAFGGTPYYHCYSLAIEESASAIQEHRPNDSLAFGFDEHDEYGEELQRVYKELKSARPSLAPFLQKIAPFDDKKIVPVQVADLFAAVARRYIISDLGGKDMPREMTVVADKGVFKSINLCSKEHLENFLRSKSLL